MLGGMTTQTQPKLDAVGIVVKDMARSLAFYREMGFDLPTEADAEPHVQAELPGGLRVLWDTIETIRSFDPEWAAPLGGPAIGLAFALDTASDVDATYERLLSLGYKGHKEPWDAFWGQRYAVIVDPDGNHVDLFSPNEAPAAT